jgi:hypothetical protein
MVADGEMYLKFVRNTAGNMVPQEWERGFWKSKVMYRNEMKKFVYRNQIRTLKFAPDAPNRVLDGKNFFT